MRGLAAVRRLAPGLDSMSEGNVVVRFAPGDDAL